MLIQAKAVHEFNGIVLIFISLLLFVAMYCLLRALFGKHRRKLVYSGLGTHHQHWSRRFHTLLFIPSSASSSMRERQQLLVGCGLMWKAEVYLVTKRMFILSVLLVVMGIYYLAHTYGLYGFKVRVVEILLCAFVILLITDKPLLESFMRHRRLKIINDVHTISRQLLYYTGSSMNLHTKLVRCLPYANSIRNELYLLTNEWYHNAAYALIRFKHRLGTEEGYSFAETINSLRQHEDDQYYELLRERVHDYKEKLELNKEGRKETMSYVLFILAGIPILFTFRLFIYPWVSAGQQLFDSLG